MRRGEVLALEWSDIDFKEVFVTVTKPMHPDTITDCFRRFIQRKNLSPITFHGLGHTNATLMISKNIDLAVVALRLGHAQI